MENQCLEILRLSGFLTVFMTGSSGNKVEKNWLNKYNVYQKKTLGWAGEIGNLEGELLLSL